MGRREDIESALTAVRGRIAAAARDADRDPGDVALIVVTKYFPVSDVRILAELGVRDVGENRHQEAEAKAEELAGLDLRWHFIGNLQSNKASVVARYSDLVQSVDRPKLLGGLGRGAEERGSPLQVLVQVDLDPDPGTTRGRGGAAPEDVPALSEAAASTPGLVLRGLMAVAPREGAPGAAFERLAALHADVRRAHPDARWLSAGMSGDLEAAIAVGATHVRVGSAVLGERPRAQ